VIIVRHGQSSYNAEQKIQGRSDGSVLTEKGHLDAEKVGNALSQIDIAAFYCSPLQRAKSTAEVIQSRLNHSPVIQPTSQLLEIESAYLGKYGQRGGKSSIPPRISGLASKTS
jgi:probable phosphoglycerate mutase